MEGHAIVEMMGHRRVVGRVSEAEVCGVKLLRVETLTDPPVVQLVSPQSLYAVTLCTEEQARRAGRYQDSPLRELQALPEPSRPLNEERCAGCGELVSVCTCDDDQNEDEQDGEPDEPIAPVDEPDPEKRIATAPGHEPGCACPDCAQW